MGEMAENMVSERTDTLPLGAHLLSLFSFSYVPAQNRRRPHLGRALGYAPHVGEHCFGTGLAAPELGFPTSVGITAMFGLQKKQW